MKSSTINTKGNRVADATVEAARLATIHIEHAVDAILGHAHIIGQTIKNQKMSVECVRDKSNPGGTMVQRIESVSKRSVLEKSRKEEVRSPAVKKDGTLVVRSVSSLTGSGAAQFSKAKKKVPFPAGQDRIAVDYSLDNNEGVVPVQVVAKRLDDGWIAVRQTINDPDGKRLVIETEVLGDATRNTRINGAIARPSEETDNY